MGGTGLTTAEAANRLRQFGPNRLGHHHGPRPLALLLEKFSSPLSLVLIAAAILSYFLGDRTNALIILLMVTVGAALDFVNSYHAERAAASLEEKVSTKVLVRRDGREILLPTQLLVPGDRVILNPGDLVPADGRIVTAKELFVDESVLTGESFPQEKQASPTGQVNVDERGPSAALMGTSVISGEAEIEVVATGLNTEFGRIAESLAARAPETDFERGIKNFSYFIIRITFVMVVFVFGANALFGRGVLESFLFAVAIAIGLTPELLPVIMSVSLSRGSLEMAKKHVIVKKLSSIQSLGSMTVFCTDKTGTLTENKIILVRWLDPQGEQAENVLRLAYISSSYHTGVSNPLDEAVIKTKKYDLRSIQKIDEIPFDFTRRRSSVVVKDGAQLQLITRGAPESVLKVCATFKRGERSAQLTATERTAINQLFQTLSADGYRVLALASRKLTSGRTFTNRAEAELTFEGFIAFLDPPKAGVKAAIEELANLGVTVKIITGDHEILAKKICREVGLTVGEVLNGEELQKLTDDQLLKRLEEVNLFARTTPEQKERLVRLYKKSGQTVGYLGDGINDAPALKAADVGISVNNAVNVAKESADIILLKKSLTVLKEGVVEGRKTFRNTFKYILMGLSSNFGNVFSMSAASVFLPFLPMLPSQILLNNFLYDMSQLSLSTDNVDPEVLNRPLRWRFDYIRKYMFVFGVLSSGFDLLTFLALVYLFHLSVHQFQTSWFIESLMTQTLVIFVIRTKKLPFLQSRPSRLLFWNVVLVLWVALLIPISPIATYFAFDPVRLPLFFLLMAIVAFYLLTVELSKRVFNRLNPL